MRRRVTLPHPMARLAKDHDGHKHPGEKGTPGGLEEEDEAKSRTLLQDTVPLRKKLSRAQDVSTDLTPSLPHKQADKGEPGKDRGLAVSPHACSMLNSEIALKLEFGMTNNETESEALIPRIKLAQNVKPDLNTYSRRGDASSKRVEVSKHLGKLDPNWEGTYKVVRVSGKWAYRLGDLQGKELPRPWNAQNLRRFYA
ncbi:hypothetical protein DH2020_018726 [Rehmannia glutinosa]|uniref:Reverse transcriptase domain-containing protein n=1 Tax=Rehmannia glutinosa TaxID=99300 RepID=A0ABR0WNT5_REHGL